MVQGEDEDSGAEGQICMRKNGGERNYQWQKVFTDEEELAIVKYLKKAANLNFGLTYELTRSLAYDYARIIKKKYPISWDWDLQILTCFLILCPNSNIYV